MVMSAVNPMANDWKYQNQPADEPRKTQEVQKYPKNFQTHVEKTLKNMCEKTCVKNDIVLWSWVGTQGILDADVGSTPDGK